MAVAAASLAAVTGSYVRRIPAGMPRRHRSRAYSSIDGQALAYHRPVHALR
jgi:hypothetical protein